MGKGRVARLSPQGGGLAAEAGVADHILDPTEVDVVAKARELTGGNGVESAAGHDLLGGLEDEPHTDR